MGLFGTKAPAAVAEPPADEHDDAVGAVAFVATQRHAIYNGVQTPCIVPDDIWNGKFHGRQLAELRAGAVKGFTTRAAAEGYVREAVELRERLAAEKAEREKQEAARVARVAAIVGASSVTCEGRAVASSLWARIPSAVRVTLAADNIVQPVAAEA